MVTNVDTAKCKTGLDLSMRDFFENVKQWEGVFAQTLSTFQLAAIAFRRDAEDRLVMGGADFYSDLSVTCVHWWV